jgi:hypothetical protein
MSKPIAVKRAFLDAFAADPVYSKRLAEAKTLADAQAVLEEFAKVKGFKLLEDSA